MSLWYEWASPIPYLFDLLSETSSFTNMAVVVRLKTNRFFSFFRFQHPKPKVNKASSGLRSKQISTEARHEEHVSRSHLQLSRKTHRVEMLRLSLHSVSRFFILRTYIKALFPPVKASLAIWGVDNRPAFWPDRKKGNWFFTVCFWPCRLIWIIRPRLTKPSSSGGGGGSRPGGTTCE